MSSSLSKPSYKKDRIAWNKAWEREHDALYGSELNLRLIPGRPVVGLFDSLPDIMYELAMQDSLVQNTHVIQSQICILQRDLSKKVSQRYAEDDFVHKWTQKCTPKERENWILEGLVRTCESSPDLEDHRRYCPEITMARLNNHSGKGFLNLLEKLTLQDIEKVPDDVKMVPNPIWEAMNSEGQNTRPGRRMLQRVNNIQRTAFLTYFVWNTLLAFYGEREEYGLIKTGKNSHSPDVKESIRNDEKFSKHFKQVRKEDSANRQNAERGCASCGLSAERAGVPTLLACQKCKAMGRYVYYCTRDCQVKDWKSGHPPHKSICGNKAALADAVLGSPSALSTGQKGTSKGNVNSEEGRDWGEPQPGYIRSPALLHQLKHLDENRQLDYVLVRPAPHPDNGVIFPDPVGKLFFCIMMRRAVSQFAPREVCRMYDQLLPSARQADGIGEKGLKRQLQREYGVDIDEWNPKFEKAAEDRLKKEGKTKEQSQAEIEDMYRELMNSMKA
ncbi:hypothetical protein VKT23_007658 [Stygiomarasmius scandens]|uniref:MYND-type domain-containing protein n=1 Tax=Marasmiellus scandens TaxID=2682957 RepID=A0ABR1JL28_9AGAR